MNSASQNNALLPSGFEDLLPPQAEVEYDAIARLMAVFRSFGYARVKPPIAEFEESLLAPGPGAALASETFRVMDPVTHRMMGLRSDITAQIARIALTRLGDEPRPLRLTYANDVIRTKGSQARTQRQFTQVGCEMIGRDDVDSDVEICVVALKGLAALGIENVTIDFAVPGIIEDIFAATRQDERGIDGLRHRLAGGADKAFAALDDIQLGADSKLCVARLKGVVDGLNSALAALGLGGVRVTIDPLETKGFEYKNDLAFALFAEGQRGELGRGGRYDIYEGEQAKESAAGFTLYMDTLRQGLKVQSGAEVKLVSCDTDWAEIKKLQDDGFIVVRQS
ncbi:MAG: ATP phosphoribosyltransferase regulatory subunit [Rhodospirillales bacterium]|nr:ATP phosphoribosyltransferase regulatory subunit [Rhodospirillales bacterium]